MSYARISKMAQRHRPTTDVRHPFYELGDKLGELGGAVGGDPVMSGDGALKALLAQVKRAHDAVHRHLEEHYLWD